MAAEDEDPAAAADRLEAALERIARVAAEPKAALPTALPTALPAALPAAGNDIVLAQVAARLDSLIGRLRAELDGMA